MEKRFCNMQMKVFLAFMMGFSVSTVMFMAFNLSSPIIKSQTMQMKTVPLSHDDGYKRLNSSPKDHGQKNMQAVDGSTANSGMQSVQAREQAEENKMDGHPKRVYPMPAPSGGGLDNNERYG
jgi:hypothetical protein